jgi:hypothetical protein
MEVQAEEGQMAGLCIEYERLWKEYSAAMHEYLGLNRPANATGGIRGSGPVSMIGPEPEAQPALAAMKARILQHGYVAHPEAPVAVYASPRGIVFKLTVQ